jgi:heptosyltransferase-1
MRVLVIKTSSLGDVVHTLAALTDAAVALEDIRFDWVVEEAFAEVPRWHSSVDRVIPVAIRRWRRHPIRSRCSGEWASFRACLRERVYERVIDAQGLYKSAVLARLARGERIGPDMGSARESLAALAYRHRLRIPRDRHAVDRLRLLFARALDYPVPQAEPQFGIERSCLSAVPGPAPYLVFLHGTTWQTKLWPEAYWARLAKLAADAHLAVRIPWGSSAECARAKRIAAYAPSCEVLPPLKLSQLGGLLRDAAGVVGVDTGPAHLAAALGTPSVTLYGATRPGLTGTMGPSQIALAADFPCAPCLKRVCRFRGEAPERPACYGSLDPERVFSALLARMAMEGEVAAPARPEPRTCETV